MGKLSDSAAFSGLCVASACGGGGKTLLSLGLARALSNKGLRVKTFKKGPDYIDSAWLSRASGHPAANLDPFFLDDAALKSLFHASMLNMASAADGGLFALLEGNRGLYDGLDPQGSCSTARLARALDLPVLLILNCEKSTRTMAALINGLASFEKGLNFAGVVLNRAGSERHVQALRSAIELETDLKVIGALPRLEKNPLPERHMGLAANGEELWDGADRVLDRLGDFARNHCDLDALLASLPKLRLDRQADQPAAAPRLDLKDRPKIGVIQDRAFWFYYPENLRALEEAGALLERLRLVGANEKELRAWDDLDGLYIGGGFPEDYLSGLAKSPLLAKIRALSETGMPIYAECGGMMLLCAAIIKDGKRHGMCGVFPNEITWSLKPRGLGYVEGEVMAENPFFPAGMKIRGHEFHYSAASLDEGQSCALSLSRGKGLGGSPSRDALLHKGVWAGYIHIFAPALPCWAKNFTKAALEYKKLKRFQGKA